jgi:hypothetical protein
VRAVRAVIGPRTNSTFMLFMLFMLSKSYAEMPWLAAVANHKA